MIEVIKTGRTVRYLTLLVPGRGRAEASVSGLKLTPSGFRVAVTIAGRTELVTVDGSASSIVDAGPIVHELAPPPLPPATHPWSRWPYGVPF